MTNFRFSARWALLGAVLALVAFNYNYHLYPNIIPAYDFIVAPAKFSLSFFSEETPFWPKLILFVGGQYLICFIGVWTTRKIISRLITYT